MKLTRGAFLKSMAGLKVRTLIHSEMDTIPFDLEER